MSQSSEDVVLGPGVRLALVFLVSIVEMYARLLVREQHSWARGAEKMADLEPPSAHKSRDLPTVDRAKLRQYAGDGGATPPAPNAEVAQPEAAAWRFIRISSVLLFALVKLSDYACADQLRNWSLSQVSSRSPCATAKD